MVFVIKPKSPVRGTNALTAESALQVFVLFYVAFQTLISGLYHILNIACGGQEGRK